MTGGGARKYIDDEKRQKCVDGSGQIPKKVTKKQSDLPEASIEKRRHESDVGKQSCTTTVPSSSAGPSHHEVRHLFTNPDCIYYGENDESFKKEAGARMNMACVQQRREISHLQKMMKPQEKSSSNSARLLELERVEKEKLKSELAEAKRISDQISTRHKKTLLNFGELKAKNEDKNELMTMFKAVSEGVDPEVYLFNLGINAALDEVAERFPDLDLNFVRECFNLPPPSNDTPYDDDVVTLHGDSF